MRSGRARELICVDGGNRGLPGEHAHDLVRREVADGVDRFFGVVGRVRCEDARSRNTARGLSVL